MRKILIIVILLAILCSLIGWQVVASRHRFEHNIASVHSGMTKSDVLNLMGSPRKFETPCYSKRPNCDQDLVYSLPFDFVSFWTISVDRSGNVLEKYHWESP